MKTCLILSVLLSFPGLFLNAQNIFSLKEKTDKYLERYSQQKVYLHFDKQNYFAGDNIWFKAYVIDAVNHKPDTLESALYVELFDTKGFLVKKEIIHIQKGYGKGDLVLPDSLSEGNYLLRAYTPWMLNFQEDFHFTRNFFIQNPEEKNFISRRTRRENRGINRELDQKSKEYSFSFFPEGGNLIYGLENRLAYHVQNSLGEGVDVRAELLNSAGNTISTFKTSDNFSGRGVTKFTPLDSERYIIKVTFPNGRTQNYPIRNIQSSGFVLNVLPKDDSFSISVSGKPVSFDSNLYLVVHTRGAIHKFIEIDGDQKFQIKNDDLPFGISAAALFDQNARLISERLFFNYPRQVKDIVLQASKANKGFIIQIEAPDYPMDSTTFSISVAGSSGLNPIQFHENIITRFLLTSDLNFRVENPLKYFTEYSLANNSIDLLMISSGWERINWPDIMKEKTPEIVFRKLDGFPIFGNIEPTDESKEFDRYSFEVTLKHGDDLTVRSTITDRQGDFKFEDIQEHGEFEAAIGVLGLQESQPRYLELFPVAIDDSKMDANWQFRELQERRSRNWTRVSLRSRESSDRRIDIADNLSYSYGSPDQIIYIKKNDQRFRNMRDILISQAPGILIDGNTIVIRGRGSINLGNQPLIKVDGQVYSSFQFLNLPPMEISHIEIYKGPSASIFGVRGGNGAIVAHSRRSSVARQIILEYILSGFYIPRNFEPADLDSNNNFSDHPEYFYTISWNPSVKLDESGQMNMQLEVPDGLENLHIILEGVDATGKIHHIYQKHKL